MALNDRDSAQVRSGLVLVVAVVFTVLGGLLLAMVDAGREEPEPTTAAGLPPSPTPTTTKVLTIVSLPTPDISATATDRPLVVPSATKEPQVSNTPEPSPVILERCTPPSDWVPYTVRLGDTLFSLSQQGGVDVDTVREANCLSSDALYPGNVLYLPSAPPEPVPGCGPPLNWAFYTVQPGDTLYSLATRSGATVSEVLFANCLTSPSIAVGKRLYLPLPLLGPRPTTSAPAPTPEPGYPPATLCVITSPADGAQVSGQTAFSGSATTEGFLFYKLEANGPETSGVWASLLGRTVSNPVINGALGTANFGGWAPGDYSVRLVIVDSTRNEVAVCRISLNVPAP
jgi:membrane-bound lytic murein transglycosylase D